MAACAGLWGGYASAETHDLGTLGPDKWFDTFVSVHQYGDQSVTVVFDGDLADLTAQYEVTTGFFVSVPCGDPSGFCTNAYGDPLLDIIHPTVAGQNTYGTSTLPQFTWTPIDRGFTLNYYEIDLCHPFTAETFCHQLERLEGMWIYGHAASPGPLSFEVTFGEAAPRAVPEPATWAMMILGFGLIGGALRRRPTTEIRL